jgi:hypothetical protein
MTTAGMGQQSKGAPKPQMGSTDMAGDANASIDDLLKAADQGKKLNSSAFDDRNLKKRSILRGKDSDSSDPESSGGGYNAPRSK